MRIWDYSQLPIFSFFTDWMVLMPDESISGKFKNRHSDFQEITSEDFWISKSIVFLLDLVAQWKYNLNHIAFSRYADTVLSFTFQLWCKNDMTFLNVTQYYTETWRFSHNRIVYLYSLHIRTSVKLHISICMYCTCWYPWIWVFLWKVTTTQWRIIISFRDNELYKLYIFQV